MTSTNWPYNFFDEAALSIIKQEDSQGDFYATFDDIARSWSELLNTELTASNVIIMLIDNTLIHLKKDPLCINKIIEATTLLACLSEINKRNKNSNIAMPVKQLSCSKKSLINVGSQ